MGNTQFAPVAPLHMLEQMEDFGILGDYHLLLAHDVVKHAERYARLFKDKGMYIIMDNSLIELGEPVDGACMLDACQIVGASVAVLPDKLGDVRETVHMSTKGLHEWGQLGLDSFLFVIQGTSLFEAARGIDTIATHDQAHMIKAWSVPKVWQERYLHSRWPVIDMAARRKFITDIHLLGMSNSLRDDLYCCTHPHVMGMDSAVPIRYGYNGRIIDNEGVDISIPRKEFMEAAGPLTDEAILNVRWVRDAVAGKFRKR